MDTTTTDDPTDDPTARTARTTGDPTARTAEPRLRTVLLTNATTSGAGGLAALIAGGPVDSLLGTDATGWVRVAGAGLVVFAVFVALVARASTATLRRETPVISLGDAAWVVGSAVTIALGWYSTGGAVVMAAVGAMVGGFGITQVVLARRLSSDSDD
jgi:hypothetical protein